MPQLTIQRISGLALAGLVLVLVAPVPHAAAQSKEIQEQIFETKEIQEQLIEFGGGFGFDFKIDPKTPIKDLLPTPPGKLAAVAPFTGDDLIQVPEIMFQEPIKPAKEKLSPIVMNAPFGSEAAKQLALQFARVRHLNQKDHDGFLKTLLAHRPDLSGLPFVMGDDCRLKKQQMDEFRFGLDILRNALAQASPGGPQSFLQPDATTAALFWSAYQKQWAGHQAIAKSKAGTVFHQSHATGAHIGALMQVLMPESTALRIGLAKYLSSVPHSEATKALAQLAIFSPEKEVRAEAINALKVRREQDYTGILVAGLKYPWAPVAQRAGEAIAQLDCATVVHQLVDLLDAPDPRLPYVQRIKGADVFVARQMVKLNHHRNCLVCHTPGDRTFGVIKHGFSGELPVDQVEPLTVIKNNTIVVPVTAPMPIPGEPMSGFIQGYGSSIPDILVRIDVTYLRQDFSVRQPVADAHPWPKMQRFDFLVRTVTLTPAQAKAFQDTLQPKAGAHTPYQDALVTTLRSLTGQNAAPNADAWRKVLKLPA